MADSADPRQALGLYLDEPLARWSFSVSDVWDGGFTASARGRRGTDAAGLAVTLRHERGQPVEWTVRHAGVCP
jgi:hypothetical protein